MTETLQLLLALAIIVVGAKLAGYASSRVHQPMVVGEIVFGLLLGPTVLDFLNWPLFGHALLNPNLNRLLEGAGIDKNLLELLNHGVLREVIHLLAEIGVILLMFLAGLETDLAAMRKVGLPALNAAIGGVILPFLGGWGLSQAIGLPLRESIFIGTILTATSVSISAQTLIELGKLRTREGMTILGAAVIDDVIGILMLSLVVALFASGGTSVAPDPVWLVALKMVAYFAAASALAGLARTFTVRFAKLPISEPLLAGALVMTFVYAFAAEYFGGVAAITGAYLAGVILASLEAKHELEQKAKALVYSLFVPVFFVDIGLRANLIEAFRGPLWLFGLGIVAVALVGKVLGSGLGALASKFSPSESFRVGVGMISRGEVGLIVAGFGLERGVIDQDIFSLMVLMVVVSTLVTPMLLRIAFHSKEPVKA